MDSSSTNNTCEEGWMYRQNNSFETDKTVQLDCNGKFNLKYFEEYRSDSKFNKRKPEILMIIAAFVSGFNECYKLEMISGLKDSSKLTPEFAVYTRKQYLIIGRPAYQIKEGGDSLYFNDGVWLVIFLASSSTLFE